MDESFARKLGAGIDQMDARKFVEFLDPNATFKFGNMPPVTGHAAISESVGGFFSAIQSIHHEVIRAHKAGDFLIVEMQVSYVDQWGRDLSVPVCNVLKFSGALVSEYIIYIDNHELFVLPEGG